MHETNSKWRFIYFSLFFFQKETTNKCKILPQSKITFVFFSRISLPLLDKTYCCSCCCCCRALFIPSFLSLFLSASFFFFGTLFYLLFFLVYIFRYTGNEPIKINPIKKTSVWQENSDRKINSTTQYVA